MAAELTGMDMEKNCVTVTLYITLITLNPGADFNDGDFGGCGRCPGVKCPVAYFTLAKKNCGNCAQNTPRLVKRRLLYSTHVDDACSIDNYLQL